MFPPSNTWHRAVPAIVNQQHNLRSLTVRCKSFAAHEDMRRINPCRAKHFKKYIIKQLAKKHETTNHLIWEQSLHVLLFQ